MPSPSANHIAYTAPINPPHSNHPPLTRAQIWACLQRKIRAGEDFVGGAIISTTVVEEHTDPSGWPVVVRDVLFRDGHRTVREVCTAYEDTRVDFLQQATGSLISNVVGDGENEGELYMTYVFDWRHPDASEQELSELRQKEKKVAKVAVESTIVAMREMVADGRIKA